MITSGDNYTGFSTPTRHNAPVKAQHNVAATTHQNVLIPILQTVQATTVPKNVPVRITNRNLSSKRLQMTNNFDTAPQRSTGNLSFARPRRTLFIGDESI